MGGHRNRGMMSRQARQSGPREVDTRGHAAVVDG
jgi:hypothetical protein